MKKGVFYFSIALAFLLWYVMFVLRPFNFWLMMAFSTSLLSLIVLWIGKPFAEKGEWRWSNVLIGVVSALVLYGVFWIGNQVLVLGERLLPQLISSRPENLASIYGNRGSLAPHWIALLLFFPIGFGEEFFWRGLVQNRFSTRLGRWRAFFLTTFLYTAVHFATGNLVLLLAAVTCGLYWGALYAWRGALLPVLISHMIWDPLIFVFFPVQ
ncbi:MAG TPA: type II CAAX endopeptidase family protein [bacterium]|nr:type II CAAX endopeptidase family protein [bacterium]HQG44085.1 type II CAAX endopeptidase family protein [bacterium]HQI48421.1 type II CAAX endopeptidase family protein [bacterium]HQJ63219.1 type II CAAX endopeptidase family protein [bacterium]